MFVKYCIGLIAVLLSTACLAFGALPAKNPSATVSQAPPTDTTVFTSTAGPVDGYTRTIETFQNYAKKAAEIQALLKKLHAESVAGNIGDTAKQRASFLAKLIETYPGSAFDGATGTVAFKQNFVATFDTTLTVDRIKEMGKITVTYYVTQGKMHLVCGDNSVTAIINQTTPSQSTFIDVTIATMKEEAEKILADPYHKRIAVDTVESAVLNDVYQLLSQTNKMRMQTFAADVISNPKLQRETLRIAENGYRERHPEDYQGGAAPSPTHKKKSAAAPNEPADSRFYESFQKISFFAVLAAGVLWGIFAGIRFLKSLSTDKSQKLSLDRYNSLSPMVTKTLKKMGTSLWGRNAPWSTNYYIYHRSDRWLLCDGKEDKNTNTFEAHTRVEVCLRGAYFKIKVTRLNGVGVTISLRCQDVSERELNQGLKKISFDILNANRDSETTGEAAPAQETRPDL